MAIAMLSLSGPFGFLGFRSSAQSVNVDYATAIGTGHPETFGGNRFPTDPAMAQQVVDASVTLTRNNYYLEVVATSRIADHENNVGNVQDRRMRQEFVTIHYANRRVQVRNCLYNWRNSFAIGNRG